MNWRLASRLSVVTMAIIVVALVALLGSRVSHGGQSSPSTAASSNHNGLQGTDLGSQPAPDFHLTDQFGHPVSLSQFRGKPVILTFLYTHCPDQCPLTAEMLHSMVVQLGGQAQQVAILAVSTDPTGDTMASAQSFSQEHKMLAYWHYLLGAQAQLAPIWTSYSVYAAPTPTSTGGSVTHSIAIFVIDKQGRERDFFSDGATSNQLVTDLQILLKE